MKLSILNELFLEEGGPAERNLFDFTFFDPVYVPGTNFPEFL
jgi:hypothetical protein